MVKKVYLFRHGQTDWNREKKLQYSTDIPLNEMGLKQAEENAEILKNSGIQYIYSSPLKRAYRTAEVLADKIGVDIEVVDELKEANGGDVEGLYHNERDELLGSEFLEKFFNTRDGGMDLRFPNGESKREIRDRISNAIEGICRGTQYDVIGISSHSCVLREFLRNYTDIEGKISLKNCEVIEAEFDNENGFNIMWRSGNE